jgi:hypothetical protein
MQQRRLRLGDILDDYCPRERRVTNHAVVALVDDDVRQTRCTACDTEHEYKQGKMPTLRRKKDVVSAAYKEVLASVTGEGAAPAIAAAVPAMAAPPPPREEVRAAAGPILGPESAGPVPTPEAEPLEATDEREATENGVREDGEGGEAEDGRVHRRLIRATLPRPENHSVERPVPEFTMRQPTDRGGRFRSGMVRGMGSRPGGAGRGGGTSGGHARGPVFGRPSGSRGGGQGGRPAGRPDAPRPHRGGQPGRHGGKKHSK